MFDAGVLSLGYAGDDRVKEYFDLVSEHGTAGFVADVNLAEFYYKTCQRIGRETADAWYYQAIESGFQVSGGEEMDRNAGLEKCRHPRLSIADCFALALAKRENALLLTTDEELAKIKEIRTKYFAV